MSVFTFVMLLKAVQSILGARVCIRVPKMSRYVYKDFSHFSLILYLSKLVWWSVDLMTAKCGFYVEVFKSTVKSQAI